MRKGLVIPITVDYTSLAKNPEAWLHRRILAGKYSGRVDPDITAEHFPIHGKGKVRIVVALVQFGWEIENDDVVTELDKE
jgi:hypothetical protein